MEYECWTSTQAPILSGRRGLVSTVRYGIRLNTDVEGAEAIVKHIADSLGLRLIHEKDNRSMVYQGAYLLFKKKEGPLLPDHNPELEVLRNCDAVDIAGPVIKGPDLPYRILGYQVGITASDSLLDLLAPKMKEWGWTQNGTYRSWTFYDLRHDVGLDYCHAVHKLERYFPRESIVMDAELRKVMLPEVRYLRIEDKADQLLDRVKVTLHSGSPLDGETAHFDSELGM